MTLAGRARRLMARGDDVTSTEGRSRERYRRAALATVASVAARVASTLVLLISIRLVGSTIAGDEFGIWLLLVTGVALVGFADLGIGNGLLNVVAEAYGRDDEQRAREAISSAFFALLVFAIVVGGVFAALYPLISWSWLFSVRGTAADETGQAVAAAIACTLVSLPFSLAQRVHLARQEGWLANLWIGAGSIGSLVAVAVATSHDARLWVLVAAMLGGLPLAYVIDSIVTFGFTNRGLRPTVRRATLSSAKAVVTRGLVFFVLASAIAVGYEADSVIISHYLGAAAVATYALPFRLFMLAPTAVQLIVVPLWPAYSEAVARGDLAWVHKTLRRSLVIAFFCAAVPSLILLPIMRPIIDHWVGQGVRPSTGLLLGIAAWAVIASISAALSVFFNGVGVLRFQLIVAIVMATANVGLSIVLVQHIGVSGPVLASVSAQIVCVLIPSWLIVRTLLRAATTDDSLSAWLTRYGRPVLS